MGLLNQIFKAKKIDRGKLTGSLLSNWKYGREHVTPMNYKEMVEAYKSWVYVASSRNSSTVAAVPLRLYTTKVSGSTNRAYPTQKISKEAREHLESKAGLQDFIRKESTVEEVLEHPFLKLMKNVNPVLNRFSLWEETDLCLELTGNAYWYIVKGSLGVPVEIWVVPVPPMKVIPDKEEFISGYEYKIGFEKSVHYDLDEIVHFKFANPNSPYYGAGPLAAITGMYNIERNMDTFENALFTNSAMPAGILTTDQSLTENEVSRLDTEWESKYRGPKRVGKTAILWGGLKYQSTMLTPRELNFLSGRKVAKETILNAYGQSLGMYDKDSTRSNSEQAEYTYMKHAILPRLCRMEEKINEKLIPLYGENFFVAFDNPVPADREFALKERESNLKSNFSSINLERQKAGEEEVSWGDVPLVQQNLVPLGTVPTIPVEDSVATFQQKDFRMAAWKEFVTKAASWEEKWMPILKSLFNAQEVEVLANIKADSVAASKVPFDQRRWIKIFAEKATPITKSSVIAGGQDGLSQAGKGFDVLSPRVLKFIKSKVFKFAVEVNDTTANALRKTLSAGIQESEGITTLMSRVQTVFTGATTYRSEMIARTEVLSSYNFGTQEGFSQAGLKQNEWLATQDSRTRDSHILLDGEVRNIGEVFSNGLVRPGDFNGAAEEVVNCRCTILPVVSPD